MESALVIWINWLKSCCCWYFFKKRIKQLRWQIFSKLFGIICAWKKCYRIIIFINSMRYLFEYLMFICKFYLTFTWYFSFVCKLIMNSHQHFYLQVFQGSGRYQVDWLVLKMIISISLLVLGDKTKKMNSQP